jgi:chaperonin GroES
MSDLNVKKLQPTAGYVLVEPAKSAEKTVSGIILPESDSEKPQYGTVLAVGAPAVPAQSEDDCCGGGCCGSSSASCCGDMQSSCCEVEAPVKVGDRVIYKKWGGNEVKIDDVEYQFLKFEDILAVIKK